MLKDSLRDLLMELDLQLDDSVLMEEVDFLSELLRWNKTHNLTAITDPKEALEKHLVDSLTLLPYLSGDEAVLDIGSGGGFPGVPLQIARRDLRTVSVDAVAKKISFQRHVARRFRLTNFTPWHGRVEQVPQQPFAVDGFDLVVARAFASLKDLLKYASPCLKPGGRVVAMKGPEGENELIAAADWLDASELYCSQQVSLTLPRSEARRYLLFFHREPQDIA